jgi:hypothetical protein
MKEKTLKINADTGNIYNIKVGDIKGCLYSPTKFDHQAPEKQKKTEPPKKIFENSKLPTIPQSSTVPPPSGIPPEFEATPELFGIIEQVISTASEILSNLPEKCKENLMMFMEGLHQNDVPFNLSDKRLLEIASSAMKASTPQEVQQLVRAYIAHLRDQK